MGIHEEMKWENLVDVLHKHRQEIQKLIEKGVESNNIDIIFAKRYLDLIKNLSKEFEKLR